jgi:hypothetical protein
MDPTKQPSPSANPGGDDLDEAKAAEILNASRPGAGAPASGAPAGPDAPAPAGGSFGQSSAPAAPGAGFGGGFSPSPSPSPAAPGAPAPGGPAAPAGMVTPKKSKKLPLIIGIIVALVVVLLGASAAAYYVVMNKPQNVLNMALVNFVDAEKAKTVSFDGSVDITPKDGGTMGTTFKGAAGEKGEFTLTGEADAMVTTVSYDMLSADGKSLYFRLGGLDGLAELLGTGGDENPYAFAAPIVAGLNNQWIQVNQSMIEQLTGSATQVNGEFSDADRQKLVDAYKKHQFLVVEKTLKDEDIKGVASKHFQVIIEKDKLKTFASEVKNAKIEAIKLSDTDLKNFNKEVDKTNFKDYPVDVWISKADKMIKQVSMSASMDGDQLAMRLTFDKYNEPVKVEAPKESKSVLEIFSEFLTSPALQSDPSALEDLGAGISL